MIKQKLASFLGPHQILSDEIDLQRYGKDWLKDYTPRPALVVLPETIAQVQAIVRICSEAGLPIVPSGGRTGLSGGATATKGEVVLSLERMNRVLAINAIDRTAVCEAGVVTQHLQEEALKRDLYFPVDFASKGSSQLGGNVATNAGGIRVIRYGNIREWVLGMKVVTADGSLLELNGSLFKNQTGYDLKSLFIGSEGTLGVIVELTMKLTTPPGELVRVLCALERVDAVLPLLTEVRGAFYGVSAFEFFTRTALDEVCAHHGLRDPFDAKHPYYIVIEFERANDDIRSSLEQFFATRLEEGAITDIILSHSQKQSQELMSYRELIAETLSARYVVHKNDISVSVPDIPAFVGRLEGEMQLRYPHFGCAIFGHIGDGNLHVNILKPRNMENSEFFRYCKEADLSVFEMVREFKGSISAEHGVGLLKKDFLTFSRSPGEIEMMRAIKRAFDPKGILNPGKIFDL